jgi:hypothetical protein
MKKLLNKLGLFLNKTEAQPYSYAIQDYKITNGDTLKTHKEFLKSIEEEENNRLTLIENKTAQLISQTGIIFALLSLFIPIFIDKIISLNIWLRFLFILVLVVAFLLFLSTIFYAIKNYNIKKFIYSKPSPLNVIKYQDKSTEEFTAIEVQDLLYSINVNLKTNNTKATNLIQSYSSFKYAIISTAILVMLLCVSLLFSKPSDNSIKISDPVKIENFETTFNSLTKTIQETNKEMVNLNKLIYDSILNKPK